MDRFYSMDRFYCPPERIHTPLLRLPPEETHHVMHVLRYRPGDRIEVTDGRGGVYTVRLRNLRGLEIEGEIEEAVYDPDEVGYELTLVVGVIKHPDRQAWLVEKATELGARRIAWIRTSRTERDQIRLDRLQRIAIAALKQSGRRWLPELLPPRALTDWLQQDKARWRLAAHGPGAPYPPISSLLPRPLPKGAIISVLIGPEGGFADQELELLRAHGLALCSLGPYRLRTETAAVAAAAALLWAAAG